MHLRVDREIAKNQPLGDLEAEIAPIEQNDREYFVATDNCDAQGDLGPHYIGGILNTVCM